MNKQELRNFIIILFLPDSKIFSDQGFVNIDDGSQEGTQWTCFIVEGNKSHYFDSFGGQPDKFSLNQLPKPIIYHTYKMQDINSKLCGSICLYFFYLIERINYYDTVLKMYFRWFKKCRSMYLETLQTILIIKLILLYLYKNLI